MVVSVNENMLKESRRTNMSVETEGIFTRSKFKAMVTETQRVITYST